MNLEYDVIIIGGGIIGAAIAFELKKSRQKVIVLDSGTPGTGITGTCMGHIVTMDDSQAQLDLTSYSGSQWRQLCSKLPSDCEDDPCGTLWVARDEEEMQAIEIKHQKLNEQGIPNSIITKNRLVDVEPNLSSDLLGGLQIKQDRVVYPTNCVKWMLDNIRVESDCSVDSLQHQSVKLKSGKIITGKNVVVACGLQSTAFFPEVGIKPRKGHLVITERYPGFCNHQILEMGYAKSAHGAATESVAFNMQPRKTGQLLLGSSRELNTTDNTINTNLVAKMVQKGLEYLPGLKDLKALRVWTGIRPYTDDNLPFIGPHPDLEHTYLAAGHEGLGITTSLGTAKLIKSMILEEEPPIDPEPYKLERTLVT